MSQSDELLIKPVGEQKTWPLLVPILSLVLSLVLLVGIIGYFGVGPLLAKPDNEKPADTVDANQLVNPEVQPVPTPIKMQLTDQQMRDLLMAMSHTVNLPKETPEVQLISDPKLYQGDFFAKAQAQDLLVIFHQTAVVFIFRPSTGAIIASGQIQNDGSAH